MTAHIVHLMGSHIPVLLSVYFHQANTHLQSAYPPSIIVNPHINSTIHPPLAQRHKPLHFPYNTIGCLCTVGISPQPLALFTAFATLL